MNRTVKKILSLALCLVMTAGILAVGASAEEPFRYVSLGDSTSMGYILNDFVWQHVHDNGASAYANYANMMRYLEEDEHIENLVGCDLTLTGCRPTELRAILDPKYYARFCDGDSKTNLNYCDNHLDQYISTWQAYGSYEAINSKYTEQLKNADLITMDMIMADMTSMLSGLVGNAQQSYGYASYAELLEAEGMEKLVGAVTALRSALEKALGDTAAPLTGFVDSALCAYAADVVNFTKCLEIIYTLNPDVNLIVVGPFNPYRNVTIYKDSIEVSLGKVVDILTGALTNYLISNEYAKNYRFADCSGGVQSLNEALGMGELDKYEYLLDQIFQRSLGSNYKRNYSLEQIEAMKENIHYACSLTRISFDALVNNAGDAKLALTGDENATLLDYEALNLTVLSGLDHAAGMHPDLVGYEQKFEALKKAYNSNFAANGTKLVRFLDRIRNAVKNIISAITGNKSGIANIIASIKKTLTPIIRIKLPF